MNRMILVPGFIFYGFLYFQWSWICLVCLWDRCILFTNSSLCMNVSRFWACPCPNTPFGQVLQVPVRWQCPFAWGLPVIKNWVMKYSPFNCYPQKQLNSILNFFFHVTNPKNHVPRSEQLSSPALSFRPSQSKLNQAHSTPQCPGFGWDRAKTSGLHHIIPTFIGLS